MIHNKQCELHSIGVSNPVLPTLASPSFPCKSNYRATYRPIKKIVMNVKPVFIIIQTVIIILYYRFVTDNKVLTIVLSHNKSIRLYKIT